MMRQMFVIGKGSSQAAAPSPEPLPPTVTTPDVPESRSHNFVGYLSDLSSDAAEDLDEFNTKNNNSDTVA
ncbi:hypothetical protein SERLADRAFT_455118, partial [Serpula lacrymans var. lacrymans S7.9]